MSRWYIQFESSIAVNSCGYSFSIRVDHAIMTIYQCEICGVGLSEVYLPIVHYQAIKVRFEHMISVCALLWDAAYNVCLKVNIKRGQGKMMKPPYECCVE